MSTCRSYTTAATASIMDHGTLTIISKISPILRLNEGLAEQELVTSRLCRAAMTTLWHMSDEGGIGLTNSGAFNRKFVVWAVDQFNWPGYTAEELYVVNKVLNQDDVLPIVILHELLRAAKLIRHVKGRAVLAREGKALLGNYGRLQVVLFETYFTRFDFATVERWPIEMPYADMQHFLGIVKHRLGDWVSYRDFAGWCLPIDILPAQRGTAEQDAMFYLATRLVRPLNWLGVLEKDEPSPFAPLHTVRLRKTPLFDAFLMFEIAHVGSRRTH